jgi:hypothetical protein
MKDFLRDGTHQQNILKENIMINNNDDIIFTQNYALESNGNVRIEIAKISSNYLWTFQLSNQDATLSFQNTTKSLKDCFVQIRNILLSTNDVVQDLLLDVKQFVLSDFNTDNDIVGFN